MDARSRPAYVGWNLFRDSEYSLTLEEINQQLERRDFPPVSDRMYTHYERLHRYGFERYVSINQFDVDRLREPVLNAATRKRYRLRTTSERGSLTLIDGDSTVLLEGTIRGVSESEVVFEPIDHIEEKPEAYEGRFGTLLSGARTLPISVEVVTPATASKASRPRFDLTVLGYSQVDDWTGDAVTPTTDVEVRIEGWDDSLLAETVRSFYALFQALEAVRIVCDAAQADLTSEEVLPLPTIVRLRHESPTELVLTVATPVFVVLSGWLSLYLRFRRGVAAAASTEGDAAIKSAVADDIKERTRSRRIVNDLAEYVSGPEQVEELTSLVEQSMARPTGSSPLPDARREVIQQLIREEVGPSFVQLLSDETRTVDIRALPDPPREA